MPRGQRIAIWLAITSVAAVLALGGWFAFQVMSAFNGTLGVSCDEAARFFRAAELPAGARDRKCTTGQWMSISYELDFRAQKEEAEAWLRTSYPGTELSRGFCGHADACADPKQDPVPFTDQDGHRLADSVAVQLTYEESGVAHVRMSGSTV
ncbi:hypothetical protein [Streptomyces sp. NBC_01465]|uniref:hypothetical protein n=1 Tax=Streptomyces sp. NBC_01465 TaxID=2903878 RepID=UPI002E3566B0|nr:hypothetical protein [Streptomyces sp. NBC_01465]